MARPNVLDDVSKQNKVLLALSSGASFDEAGEIAGVTRQLIRRYMEKNRNFGDAVEAARAAAERLVQATEAGVTATTPRPRPPPTADQSEAAEMLGVDVDLIQDADGFVDASTVALAHPTYGTLTTRNFLNLLWDRSCKGGAAGPAWARLLAPVMLTPTIEAQARRDAAKARGEGERPAITSGASDSEQPVSRAGMTVLEVPANKARPFLQRSPEIVDAELVE